jgi:hypothetical protein
MHVGKCTSCTTLDHGSKPTETNKKTVTAGQTAPTTKDVYIYCSGSPLTPTVYPPNVTANTVSFEFQGTEPPDPATTPFSVTIGPNVCSNYPIGTTIQKQGGSCAVAQTFTYQVTNVLGCDTANPVTGTISPPK